jgi:hypothetical protein
MSGQGLPPAVSQHLLIQHDILIVVALSPMLRESITKDNQGADSCPCPIFAGISLVFRWYFAGISLVFRWYFAGISLVFRWYFR